MNVAHLVGPFGPLARTRQYSVVPEGKALAGRYVDGTVGLLTSKVPKVELVEI